MNASSINWVAAYNRATKLAHTCLEGHYKGYVPKHVPVKSDRSDLMRLCKVVKDNITEKRKVRGSFPEQIVNAIPTLTKVMVKSRNSFGESHFVGDAHKWLVMFARDMTKSIGRLLLYFI